jgi:hypothetical protein
MRRLGQACQAATAHQAAHSTVPCLVNNGRVRFAFGHRGPVMVSDGLGIIALLFSFVFPGNAALFIKKVGKPRARLRRPAAEGNSMSQRL